MKISIIAHHMIMKPGAGLQLFALQTYLSDLGHNVSIIDYRPSYLTRLMRRDSNNLSARIFSGLDLRSRNFAAFRKFALNISEPEYTNPQELMENPPEADLYITCNDEYWTAAGTYDPAFMLEFVPAGRIRATYGTSSTGIMSGGNDLDTASVKRAFSKFDYISLRSPEDMGILKNIGILRGTITLDQSLLLSKERWDSVMPDALYSRPYLFVYNPGGDPELERAAQYLKSTHNWDICTSRKEKYADIFYSDAGPFEYLSLVGHAQYVLTDSYCCSMLALALRRPFTSCPRNDEVTQRLFASADELELPEGRVCETITPELLNRIEDTTMMEASLRRKFVITSSYFDMMLRRAARNARHYNAVY